MAQLDGKIAIVTGAGRGLGRAIAEEFAAEGAKVVVSDIDLASAESVASSLDGASARACDVRDEGQVQQLVDDVVAEHGGLDIMVPNAGVAGVGPIVEMSLDDWREVTAVNLDGVFLCVRFAALAMAQSGGGAIVNIASVTSFNGSPLIAHYAAAKAGVWSLTRTAAVEMRAHGVRVNSIHPGFIETDMVTPERKKAFEDGLQLPMPFDELITATQGRYGTPREVARMAVFLASDRSSFCSGSSFTLDGGLDASLL